MIVRELGVELFGSSEVATTVDNPKALPGVRALVYRGHTATVTVAKFSPSGRYVASADIRGKLRVWAYDHEEHLCKLELQAFPGIIRDVAWDGEGKRITIVGEGSKSMYTKCVQWDTGVQCGPMGGHTKRVITCDMRQKRPFRIMSGGEDQKCVFFSGPPFKIASTLGEHSGTVNCVRFSHNSEYVVSVGSDKKVVLYEGKTGGVMQVFEGKHTGSIYSCSWSEDDTKLLTCSADKTVNLMSIPDGNILKTWNIQNEKFYSGRGGMAVACTFCEGKPIVVGVNGIVSLLDDDVESCIVKALCGHQVGITALAIDKNGDQIFTSDSDGLICKVNGADLSISRITGDSTNDITEAAHGGIVKSVAFVDGLIISTGFDDMIRTSCPQDERCISAVKLPAQPVTSVSGAEITFIATVNSILSFKKGKLLKNITISFDPLCCALNSDETILCVGSRDGYLRSFCVSKTDGEIKESNALSLHTKPLTALAFSPDGSKIASGDTKDVFVHSVADWSSLCKGRWCFHTSTITGFSWSKDGTILASCGADENIFLWNLEKKMRRVHYPFTHRGGVTGIAFLNDIKLLSVGADGCICTWDVSEDIKSKFG